MPLLTTRSGKKFVAGDYYSATLIDRNSISQIYSVDDYTIDKIVTVFESKAVLHNPAFRYIGNSRIEIAGKSYPLNNTPLSFSIAEYCSLNALRYCRNIVQIRHHQPEPIFTSSEHNIHSTIRMDYVPGKSLARLRQENNLSSLDLLLAIVDLTNALEDIKNKGIIHRDIKPHNIIYTREQESGYATLIDFNISLPSETSIASLPEDLQLVLKERSESERGVITGTVRYLSPEQATGETLTPASDHFSLGITIARLILGVSKQRHTPDYSAPNSDINPISAHLYREQIKKMADYSDKSQRQLLHLLKRKIKSDGWQLKKVLDGLESVLHPEPEQRDLAFLRACAKEDLGRLF